MTCRKEQNCGLCQPDMIQRRGRGGRFVAGKTFPGWFWNRKPSPYVVEGRLIGASGRILKDSKEPHLEFCEGCLKRMGVKIPGAKALE